MNNIRIKDFITNEWCEYADYDNRRAIPHIMDGLKITQRKALYTATKIPKSDKPIRVSQFASKISEMCHYHHGEQSVITTVINLAQDYVGSNNYPLLFKQGQFGNRLNGGVSSAPRYINTKLHNNWDVFFNEEDQNVVTYLYDDGDKIEPTYFIPSIPMILVNGAEGMGNGFSTKILSYSVPHIISAIKEYMKTKTIQTKLVPFIRGHTGAIEKSDKQTTITGIVQKINSYKLHITELPPHYDNEKFKKILNDLVDKKVIKDYENHSTEDSWSWIIKCGSELSSKSNDDLIEIFSLRYRITENIVCWGMDGQRPITFDSPEELLKTWCDERLKLYQDVIEFKTNKIKQDIIAADLKVKFLEWCIKNDIKNFTKKELLDCIQKNIKHITPELSEKFVSLPIYKITKDEIEKEKQLIQQLLDELDIAENTTPDGLMIERLKSVKL